MGSPEGEGEDDEHPQHEVTVAGFWLGKYEVTVKQYRQFCQRTGREMPEAPSWGWQDDHPVVNVSWHDAVAYCEWAGVRLPTEAEWEYAARGSEGRIYPWGNEWDPQKCNSAADADGFENTAPVGSFPAGASPFGVHDLAGNVWEWCSNKYRSYPYQANDGRENLEKSDENMTRVLRGGSWCDFPTGVRAANRVRNTLDYRLYIYGFRCAASRP